jgi:hypothetical protein
MPTLLARRIIAVSPDPNFGAAVAGGLAAVADTVDVQHAVDVLGAIDLLEAIAAPGPGASSTPAPAALCVIHLEGELAGAVRERWSRLAAGCPVLVVYPGANLVAVVELMQASDRVAGVMIAEAIDPRALAALASRILADEPQDLAQAMAPDTQIHTRAVGDYQARSLCMLAVAELVEQAGVPRGLRAPIEQCLDEMLMNALYDAPVDAQGKPLFAGIPTRTRTTLRTERSVVVQYACDGKQLALSVRDAFGSLARETVLRHLHKGLHAAQQVERKVAGAGLGLYLMTNAATAVSFHVVPGIATEARCVFALDAPKPGLAQLGFVQHAAAGPRTKPARRLRAGSRRRALVSIASVAVVALLGFGVLWQLGGAQKPSPATVELDSQPTGAAVAIDGKSMGSTPVTLTSLAPGQTVSIVFERTGYRVATARLQVPAAGGHARLIQPLEISEAFVRVRFVSNPPGAEVVNSGQAETIDRTYTPADVFVEANQVQRFTLTMAKHVPLVIEPFVATRPAGTSPNAPALQKGGDLVEGANLHLEATLAGKVTVSGAPHCQDVTLPADCTLAPGRYVVAYAGPDHTAITRTVVMTTEDAIERLALGLVEAAPGKLLQPGGRRHAVFEAGAHVVTVSDAAGTHKVTVTVRPGATVIVN